MTQIFADDGFADVHDLKRFLRLQSAQICVIRGGFPVLAAPADRQGNLDPGRITLHPGGGN